MKPVKCCGHNHATPFCPTCGTPLRKSPVSSLLVYLKAELAAERKALLACEKKYNRPTLVTLAPASSLSVLFPDGGPGITGTVHSRLDSKGTQNVKKIMGSIITLVEWIEAIGLLLDRAGGEDAAIRPPEAEPTREIVFSDGDSQ